MSLQYFLPTSVHHSHSLTNSSPLFPRELSDHTGSSLPGFIVLLSQLGHLMVMADFFYYYFRSLQKGVPMQLPIAHYSTSV
jgi:hypothetical protein